MEDAEAAWPMWSAICPADYTKEQFLKHYEQVYHEAVAKMTDTEYSDFVELRTMKNTQRLGDIADAAEKYIKRSGDAQSYMEDKFKRGA